VAASQAPARQRYRSSLSRPGATTRLSTIRTTEDRADPPQPSVGDAILAAVPSLRAFAISLSGNVDRADDLVQETLLRAITNINSFQPGSHWLTVNATRSYFPQFPTALTKRRCATASSRDASSKPKSWFCCISSMS